MAGNVPVIFFQRFLSTFAKQPVDLEGETSCP
jgi:hypothetical protein